MPAQGFNQGPFGQVIAGWNPTLTPSAPSTLFGPGPGTIAYRALRLAGYIQTGTVPEPEIVQDCLDEINSMLDGWDTEQLTQQFFDDRYFAVPVPPTNNTQLSYTMGPTGTISTDINGLALTYRPQRIVRANLVLLNNTAQPVRIPIRIYNVESYADIPVLNIQSQVVINMYVQTTLDNITLWMFPVPTQGNLLEFFMWPGSTKFVSQSSSVVGNPGLLDALVYNLAERLFLLVGGKDRGRAEAVRGMWLRNKAIETKRRFEVSNAPTPLLDPDINMQTSSGNGAPFNYLTGDYSQ